MTESSWKTALGSVPSGIYILTVRHGEEETGMLASWVMQAGFDPPSVTVAVKKGRYVADWLAAKSPFVLNVLTDEQKNLLGHFGRGFEPGEPAFTDLEIDRTEQQVPVLKETIGYLECEVTGQMDSGDHHIFLAKVTGGNSNEPAQPMVHIRKSGLHY